MLPFTAEVLFSLHGRYLSAQWLPIGVVLIVTLAAVLAVALCRAQRGRLSGGLLAIGWLWVGAVFHLQYFATLNFAAPVYGGMFLLQAALLAWQGPVRSRLPMCRRQDAVGRAGLLIALYALAIYPLLDLSDAGTIDTLRLAGTAPGPTALLTLGLLLQLQRPVPLYLLVVPVAWALVAGFSGWVLGLTADLLLPVSAVAGLGVTLWHRHRQRPPAG